MTVDVLGLAGTLMIYHYIRTG